MFKLNKAVGQAEELIADFPEVHPKAQLKITFQRTLRLPDDGREHSLPAGLGNFPLRHVDDCVAEIPESMADRGGIIMPMYQREAMWLNFEGTYPMAVKIAAGKINAVTGKPWDNCLSAKPQDYMVTPDQPWLDGFYVQEGVVRQFVAEPLGQDTTVEEIMTSESEWVIHHCLPYESQRIQKGSRARDPLCL